MPYLTDDERAGVLADIAFRHVDAKKRQTRVDIALRIFNETGSVSADEVSAAFLAEWVEPDPQAIADLVAAKCAAAVEFHERQAAAEDAAVEAHTTKVAKAEERLEALRTAPAPAKPSASRAEVARELLAAATGDPSRVQPSTYAASAGVADATQELN